MTDVLNLVVEIYRKETENSGTMTRPFIRNITLNEGDEIRLSIMNVEEVQSLSEKANKEVDQ